MSYTYISATNGRKEGETDDLEERTNESQGQNQNEDRSVHAVQREHAQRSKYLAS